VRYARAFLVGLLGIAGVVLGELDDSPGLQLIGVAVIAAAVVLAMRGQERNGPRTS
jgi:hypothetical protein